MLMVSLGFTACNSNDDFDEYQVNYPTELPTGFYDTDYPTTGEYTYSVLWTKDKDGKAICQIMRGEVAKGGIQKTLLSSSEIDYADSTGLITVTSDAKSNFFEKDTKAFLSYQKNLNKMTLQIIVGENIMNSVVLKKAAQGTPAINSIWVDSSKQMFAEFTTDTIKGSENANVEGKLQGAMIVGEAQYVFGYTFENGVGEFTTTDGATGKLSYNDMYQLVVEFGGVTYTSDRQHSTPAPEVFIPLYKGDMKFGLQSLASDADVYFDETCNTESILLQSAEKSNRYCIRPWLGNNEGLIFEMEPETGAIIIPKQTTGYGIEGYGAISVVDLYTMFNDAEMAGTYNKASKTFEFLVAYTVNGQPIAFQFDAYTITGEAPQETAAAKAKACTFNMNTTNKMLNLPNGKLKVPTLK